MSLYDTLTGINTTTFTLVLALFGLTFLPWLKLNKWLKGIVRVVTMLTMVYFLLVGWQTLDSVSNEHKNRQVSLKSNAFTYMCNLRQLYELYGSRATSKDFSERFDCEIISNKNMYLWPKEDERFVKLGEVKAISNKQIFTIVNLVKTNSYGLGASFGGNGVLFYILNSNNRTYIIYKTDLEKEGKIK